MTHSHNNNPPATANVYLLHPLHSFLFSHCQNFLISAVPNDTLSLLFLVFLTTMNSFQHSNVFVFSVLLVFKNPIKAMQ